MSKPREPYWGYVKNCIRMYPELKRKAAALRETSITPRYDGAAGPGASGSPTEAAALRCLPGKEQQYLNAVEQAMKATRQLPNGEKVLTVIRLVYWQQSHTLRRAGETVCYSYSHTKRIHEQFLYRVAQCLGLKDEPQEPKMSPKSQKSVVEW